MGETTHTAGAPDGRYRVATRTHVGLRRERNEDYLEVARSSHGLLLVVCDGMGGHSGGQVASRLATESFVAVIAGAAPDEDAETLLRRGVDEAGSAVVRESMASPEYAGMGTTLVAALLRDGVAHVVNIGDSRAYHYHGGTLERITRDHSYVWELVEQGLISEEDAEKHPRRNVITRALGGNAEHEPDTFVVRLDPGDLLLLSTDGLHGMISGPDIADALAAHPDPVRACDDLVERALTAGGKDNVTVALVRLDDGTPFAEPTTDPGAGRKKAGTGGSSRSGAMFLVFMVLALAGFAVWYVLQLGERSHNAGIGADSVIVVPPPIPESGIPDSMIYDVAPEDMVHPGDTIRW